mmetsp:Transcript_25165/g.86889  ORF Transcript_25165/g.86889 Transcript_25165/m.86889 type:complete len:605 (-) Transcript_25165:15-1829(-)
MGDAGASRAGLKTHKVHAILPTASSEPTPNSKAGDGPTAAMCGLCGPSTGPWTAPRTVSGRSDAAPETALDDRPFDSPWTVRCGPSLVLCGTIESAPRQSSTPHPLKGPKTESTWPRQPVVPYTFRPIWSHATRHWTVRGTPYGVCQCVWVRCGPGDGPTGPLDGPIRTTVPYGRRSYGRRSYADGPSQRVFDGPFLGPKRAENGRPTFSAQVPSVVDGRPQYFVHPLKRRCLCAQAYTVIVVLIAIVISLVVVIYVARFQIGEVKSRKKRELFGFGCSILTSVQIAVMNYVYDLVARKLNDLENHRTHTDYEDALIFKTCLFQFVNSYSSLIYIAFIKPFTWRSVPCVGGVDERDCIAELSAQLGAIFGVGLVISNMQEVGLPALQNYYALDSAKVVKTKDDEEEGEETIATLTALEEQFLLADWSIEETLFENYLELMVQFGYATLFSAAFPLAPLLALVNNYVEQRVDAWKLCQQSKRAEPLAARSIGTWARILDFLAVLSIHSNAMLLCFTGEFLNGATPAKRLLLFLAIEHALALMKLLASWSSSEADEDVEMQSHRERFFIEKIFLDVPDDFRNEEDADAILRGVRPNLTVHLDDCKR